jgi:hypothetical protein
MKAYVPSVRDVHGLKRAPVLADAALTGEWIPPTKVYIAQDVDARILDLERQNQALRAQCRDWEDWLASVCV